MHAALGAEWSIGSRGSLPSRASSTACVKGQMLHSMPCMDDDVGVVAVGSHFASRTPSAEPEMNPWATHHNFSAAPKWCGDGALWCCVCCASQLHTHTLRTLPVRTPTDSHLPPPGFPLSATTGTFTQHLHHTYSNICTEKYMHVHNLHCCTQDTHTQQDLYTACTVPLLHDASCLETVCCGAWNASFRPTPPTA